MLQKRLSRSKEARAQFVSSQIDKGISYQVRALRDRQGLSQERLAELVGMNQNAISRLESPQYGRATISTLKRLASAFDVALIVRFVPFSQLVKWVSGTPFVDTGLSTESMAVPNFEEEKEKSSYFRIAEMAEVARVRPPNEVTDIGAFRRVAAGNNVLAVESSGYGQFREQSGMAPPHPSAGQQQFGG